MQEENVMRIVTDSSTTMELAVLSALGDRDEQQDCFGTMLKEDGGIAVVCDGMGGRSGGKLASRVAVETVLATYKSDTESIIGNRWVLDCLKEVDRKVAALVGDDGAPLQAGSTITTVIIEKGFLHWASVGDSRAYLLRGSEFVQFTLDQNYKLVLDEKLRADAISSDEYAMEAARGDALISFLGIGGLSLIDYNEEPLPLQSGDKIIIMTDGLYKLISDAKMQSIVTNFSNLSDALQALSLEAEKSAVKEKTSRDNITIGIVRIK